jgi:hypothetical protein
MKTKLLFYGGFGALIMKDNWWMIKNSKGGKDAALTLMLIAFFFSLMLAGLGAIETLSIATYAVAFRSFDMGFATTVLIPLIGLYFGRRWTRVQEQLHGQQELFANKEEQ